MDESPAAKLARTKRRKRPQRPPSRAVPKIDCRLRAMRHDLNISLADVAGAVGMSVSGLHAIEAGGDVRMTTALRLAIFYGCSLSHIWGTLIK